MTAGAEVVVLGTVATAMVTGALGADVRAWALACAVALATVLDVASPGDGPLSGDGWVVVALALAACAVLRSPPPLPRPVVVTAPVAGSLAVLVASVVVLVVAGLDGRGEQGVPATTAGWAVVWAGTAALAVTVRGGQLVHVLAHLATSRHEALTDDLTGLANRRALDRRLDDDLAAGRPTTLMIVDLDDFKEVNDRFGHAVGDGLLRRTGALLRGVGPSGALVARMGGDEFALVLPDPSPGPALALFAALARITHDPVVVDGRRIPVHGSVGIATAGPGESADGLLRQADAAMYRAKSAGGARVAVHDEEAALQAALRARLVEEHGLMPALTTTVVWQAVPQAARWREGGHRLRVSVNLSATCLTHADLPALVDDVLLATGLDAGDLVLEVTETSIVSHPQESIARLHELAGRGLDVSIDDYGSGHSSLAYLNDLPAAELKLDRSLTSRVTASPRTADIVAGTIALAHRLDLCVIAEGVEDRATLEALRAMGCDETQGYLHARPTGAEAFGAWLAGRGGDGRPQRPGRTAAEVAGAL